MREKRGVVVLLLCFIAFFVGFGLHESGKEVPMPKLSGSAEVARQLHNSPPVRTLKPDNEKERWIETVSWEPRIFIYHNFLTEEECNEIIQLAEPDISRSLVVGKTGNDLSDVRTSHGVFADFKHMTVSPLLRNIEKRIAEWTKLPIENGESFYIIRYKDGEKYEPHMDYFSSTDEQGRKHIENEGNRMATVLTYLNAPEEGGETTFPRINLKVSVKAGDSVLFWDMDPSNTVDPLTLHGSVPVVKGVKWSMPKWIREKPTYRWDQSLSQSQKAALNQEELEWIQRKQQNTLT
eukprot:TRINITY_DN21215_c0_g1_i1.p1 TRINITY_DN21215_c0_g1~~TRINITY_DN21215_c0_g1_i1.p1  ORF type:complete len:293 (-),score=48.62 TRINITY_DN21215_c0_g1_i1:13-891(-)